jgi:hypothetical protein
VVHAVIVPAPRPAGNARPATQEEGGSGLFLVAALSARWDWYLAQEPAGKVVWRELDAGLPAARCRVVPDG